MFSIIRKTWNSVLEAIFPTTPLVSKILSMSACEILNSVNPADKIQENNMLAILSYKQPIIRTAIWEMKYRGHKGITKKMAEIMYDYLIAEISDAQQWQNFTKPVIVPIPISKKKMATRGFNQAERLARELKKLDRDANFTIETDCLIKIKETESQSHTHNRTQRLKNLENCFGVKNHDRIIGKNIILLDDVTTTGATMKEAKRVLKDAGVKKVICLSLAH